MCAENSQADPVSGAGGAETLRGRLERFGDPHGMWQWTTGEIDYIAALALTAADVPELLAIARQWAEPFDWPEDENDVSGYAPIHAWRGLAQLRAAEAIGPLLEMMDPLDGLNDDWYLDEFPHVFAWIGPASTAPLRDYLLDDRHGVYPRTIASGGLKELARRHDQVRDDVVKMLCEALSKFEQSDETFNGLLVADLLDLKAAEAAELIERAHAADRVDTMVCGCWETVRKELGVEGLGLVPKELAARKTSFLPPDLQAKFEAAAERLFGRPLLPEDHWEEPDDADYPDDLDDVVPDGPFLPLQPVKKAGRNDPCPCGSGKKYKKCCWR
ncbi:MAG: DUF1186 domain-containing protein [Planctomycetota bacterium]|nr:DUF1186 domain-containing protein [Planctomycetota bacterium]